jgi:hypothetical protein
MSMNEGTFFYIGLFMFGLLATLATVGFGIFVLRVEGPETDRREEDKSLQEIRTMAQKLQEAIGSSDPKSKPPKPPEPTVHQLLSEINTKLDALSPRGSPAPSSLSVSTDSAGEASSSDSPDLTPSGYGRLSPKGRKSI